MPAKSITKNEAFMFFMDYIAEVSINIVDERKSDNILVLIGHYDIVFDIRILFRTSTATFRQALRELNVHFRDSLTSAKHLLKEQ